MLLCGSEQEGKNHGGQAHKEQRTTRVAPAPLTMLGSRDAAFSRKKMASNGLSASGRASVFYPSKEPQQTR